MKLLKALPLDNKTPVQYVCFHPIAAAHLQNGETINQFTGEKYEPTCMAINYTQKPCAVHLDMYEKDNKLFCRDCGFELHENRK